MIAPDSFFFFYNRYKVSKLANEESILAIYLYDICVAKVKLYALDDDIVNFNWFVSQSWLVSPCYPGRISVVADLCACPGYTPDQDIY